MSRKSGNRFSDQDMRAQTDSVRELAMQRKDWRDGRFWRGLVAQAVTNMALCFASHRVVIRFAAFWKSWWNASPGFGLSKGQRGDPSPPPRATLLVKCKSRRASPRRDFSCWHGILFLELLASQMD
jgi:hypothetical protein